MKKGFCSLSSTFAAMLLFLALLSSSVSAQTIAAYRLLYGQVANGQVGAGTYATTLLVTNLNNVPVQAYIDTFQTGNPVDLVNLGFTVNCSVDSTTNQFTIPANASCQFVSDGGSNGDGTIRPLTTGWLSVTLTNDEVSAGYEIGGFLVYSYYQGAPFNGSPLFKVGVSPSPALSWFTVPVVRDVATNQDMGFAIANPFGDAPVNMAAQLIDSSGNQVDQTTITLAAYDQEELYLSQLFPNSLGAASNFVGTLYVTAQNATVDAAVAAVLIQEGNQFGSGAVTLDPNTSIYSFKRSSGLISREQMTPTRAHEKLKSAVRSSSPE